MRIVGLTSQYANTRYANVSKPWSFPLAAWKAEGEAIVVNDLRVFLPDVPSEWAQLEAEWAEREARIRPANIICCEVSWPPNPAVESWDAQSVTLQKWLPFSPDLELLAYQEQMLHPPKEMECSFGTLCRDERFDQLKGVVDWGGESIEVMINGEFGANTAGQAEILASILADQSKWNAHMATIIENEHSHWGEIWAQDNELGISCADYAAHFRLESIEMISPDMLSFWLNDGGLYGGHAIELCGNPDYGFEQFALQG
jgi:hypothetical protein